MKDDQIRIKVSKDFKNKFKNFCHAQDKNMSKVIIRLIKNYMEDENGCNISNKKQA